MFYLILFSFIWQTPQPLLKWQAPFTPEIALIDEQGNISLSSDSKRGSNLYTYDKLGNLATTSDLPFPPRAAFVGLDRIWLHDGERRLTCLSADHVQSWQKSLGPPEQPPVVLAGHLVYPLADQVLLLNPKDGGIVRSLHYEGLQRVILHQNKVYLSDQQGPTFEWMQEKNIKRPVFDFVNSGLRFISQLNEDYRTLTFFDGTVWVEHPIGKKRWRRHYNIDINTAPVWLRQDDGKPVLVMTSHARNIQVYSHHGMELARERMAARPVAMVRFSEKQCLVVPNEQPHLFWYDADKARFTMENLASHQKKVAMSNSFVLLVGGDGIIRLYQKSLSTKS